MDLHEELVKLLAEGSRFWVAGLPRPKGSMKAFVRGRRAIMVNDSTRTKPWQELVAWTASRSGCDLIMSAPVHLEVEFYLPRGKSVKRAWPEVKPDIDKLVRCVMDALTGIAWKDDAQVVRIEAGKLYAHDAPACGADIRVRRHTGG